MTEAPLVLVTCIDCGKSVPFDQVKYGNPRCPKNVGASGVQYGHRIPRDLYDRIDQELE